MLPIKAARQILAEPKHVSQTMPSLILYVTESADIHCCAHWWVKSAKMGQLLLCVNAYWNMQWNRNKTWQLPAVLVPKTSWVIWRGLPSHNMNPWLRWGLTEENWSHVGLPWPSSCFFYLTAAAASLGVLHCLGTLLLRWNRQRGFFCIKKLPAVTAKCFSQDSWEVKLY